jgi:hypothetical protein
MRNKATEEIREAKHRFEYKLAENIKEDPKTSVVCICTIMMTLLLTNPYGWHVV